MIKGWSVGTDIPDHAFQLRIESARKGPREGLSQLRPEDGEESLVSLAVESSVPELPGIRFWTHPEPSKYLRSKGPEAIRDAAVAQRDQFQKYVAKLLKFGNVTPARAEATVAHRRELLFLGGLAFPMKEALSLAMEMERSRDDDRMAAELLPQPEAEVADFVISEKKAQEFNGLDVKEIRRLTGYTTRPFIRHAGGEVFIEWQERLLREIARNRYVIVVGSRQMGKTYSVAELVFEESWKPGSETMVVSISVDSATQTLRYLREFMRNFPSEAFSYDKARRILTNNVSGGRVSFRTVGKPEDADRIRGSTVDLLVVDEAAFVDDEVFESVLEPTLDAREGRLVAISTPRGKNWFHRLFAEALSGKLPSSHAMRVTFRDNPVLPPARRAVIESRLDRPNVRREYCCEFVEGGDAFDVPAASSFPKVSGMPCVLAYDPARRADRAGYALRVLDRPTGKWVAAVADAVPEDSKRKWEDQAKFLLSVEASLGARPLRVMDVTGLGDPVAEIARGAGWAPDVLVRYTGGTGEKEAENGSGTFTEWNVGKSLLVSRYMDSCASGACPAYRPTCGKLFEEASFATVDRSVSGMCVMKSPFFDDVLNADMVASWAASRLAGMAEAKASKEILRDPWGGIDTPSASGSISASKAEYLV